MNQESLFVIGFALGLISIPALWALAGLLRVEVEDGEAILVTRFGKLQATLQKPGWHWLPDRVLPWVHCRRVSLRRDFRTIPGVVINDSRGTTVIVDVWLELQVKDPAKAAFAVDDWDRALRNLVSHAVTSILGNRKFEEILCDRSELGRLLQRDIEAETQRWGIHIDPVFVQRVSLLPSVTQQILDTISARLERAKADIEEDGRQRVALHEAETSAKTATLMARAKGQYPAAVGRALERLRSRPEVLAAYEELYELNQLRPHRLMTFRGFKEGEIRAVDAAMLAPAGDTTVVPLPTGEAKSNGHPTGST